MALLLRDPALRRDLAEHGHRRAVQDFSSQAILAQYVDLYRRLLGA
jgi:glycosyltransferase involved in cell wall biosynthesis